MKSKQKLPLFWKIFYFTAYLTMCTTFLVYMFLLKWDCDKYLEYAKKANPDRHELAVLIRGIADGEGDKFKQNVYNNEADKLDQPLN